MQDGKVVIFVNISTNSFIQYTEKAFNRLKILFETFSDETNFLLWWRPHPNLKNELRVSGGDLLYRYELVEREYLSKKIGILDRAETIDHAYEVSDIYYGDCGTVIEEFKKRGKRTICVNYTGYFFPIGICKMGDNLYGTTHDEGTIVKLDLASGIWKYIKTINGCEGLEKAFHKTVVVNNKVYFIPYKACKLVCLDPKTLETDYLDLGLKAEYMSRSDINFFGFFVFSEMLYLIPVGYRKMLRVNLKTNEVDEYMDFSELNDKDGKIKWLSWKKISDYEVAIVSCTSNELLIINVKDNKKYIKRIGNGDVIYNAIRKKENEIFLIGKNKLDLCVLNLDTFDEKHLTVFPSGIEKYGVSIFDDHATVIYGDRIYCFPANSNKAIVIDVRNYSIRGIDSIDKYINLSNKSSSQFDTTTSEGKFIFLQHQSLRFITFDMEQECVVAESKCMLSEEEFINMEIDLLQGMGKRKLNE